MSVRSATTLTTREFELVAKALSDPRRMALLEAIAGREHIDKAYADALAHGYLWHEFGDLHLIV